MHRGTAETTVPASEISEAERAVQNADFKALGTTLFLFGQESERGIAEYSNSKYVRRAALPGAGKEKERLKATAPIEKQTAKSKGGMLPGGFWPPSPKRKHFEGFFLLTAGTDAGAFHRIRSYRVDSAWADPARSFCPQWIWNERRLQSRLSRGKRPYRFRPRLRIP